MFRWYVVNTYSGHENKVKQNLEHRVVSLGQKRFVRSDRRADRDGLRGEGDEKVTKEQRTMPGYVLVNMELNEDSWQLVKGTPGVTGFVGASNEPVPLTQPEVDRLLHREIAQKVADEGAVHASASRSRSSPARCRTSPGRSPRSTRTRRSSRSSYPSSAARRRSRSASTRSRRSKAAAHNHYPLGYRADVAGER